MLGRTIRRATAVALAAGALWAPTAAAQATGPGGPVLVVTDTSERFGDYYAEILRAEGLNEFAVANVGSLSPALLSSYQVVVLGETSVSGAQVSALTDWVNAGGNLIAMRPGDELAGLLGIGADAGDVSDGYMAIDTSTSPGAGITGGTMQFHGTADRRALAGARQVAGLYTGASSSAGAPAVTLRDFGGAGGQAAAFTYDLARSVVYTRQGNPAWAGQDRDGISPVRSNDLFFGGGWLDFDRVRIPQADEQQRLLANLIIQMNLDRTPLPRFWYLPRGENAAVVLTGDDHGNGGTTAHLNRFRSRDPGNCSVADWECVRSTSYVYADTSIPGRVAFQNAGFEIALHLDTSCSNLSMGELTGRWDEQLNSFRSNQSGLAAPRTNRTHCIVWSDYTREAEAGQPRGIRLDTNYYYYPATWFGDRPGLFTGSGFPQRFGRTDGSLVDVYQATTQLTDESDPTPVQSIPAHIQALIAAAQGAEGYYGVFTANMHTDDARFPHPGADAIIAEAQLRSVPIVSAAQMLDWLDGRNGSAFRNLSYTGNVLQFSVSNAPGSRGIQGMLPASSGAGGLASLTRNGVSVPMYTRAVKGMNYVFFPADGGDYVAIYGSGVPETTITSASVSGTTAKFGFVSNMPASGFECKRDSSAFAACASPKQYTGLTRGTHTLQVRAISAAGVVDPSPAVRQVTVGTTSGSGGVGNGPGERGPAVRITPKRVRITEDGTVRLRVRCPKGQRKCRVKLKLKSKRKTVAARTFLVKAGKSRVIEMALQRSTRASLARKRTLLVTAVAVSKNPAGDRAVTRKTIRLVGR